MTYTKSPYPFHRTSRLSIKAIGCFFFGIHNDSKFTYHHIFMARVPTVAALIPHIHTYFKFKILLVQNDMKLMKHNPQFCRKNRAEGKAYWRKWRTVTVLMLMFVTSQEYEFFKTTELVLFYCVYSFLFSVRCFDVKSIVCWLMCACFFLYSQTNIADIWAQICGETSVNNCLLSTTKSILVNEYVSNFRCIKWHGKWKFQWTR